MTRHDLTSHVGQRCWEELPQPRRLVDVTLLGDAANKQRFPGWRIFDALTTVAPAYQVHPLKAHVTAGRRPP